MLSAPVISDGGGRGARLPSSAPRCCPAARLVRKASVLGRGAWTGGLGAGPGCLVPASPSVQEDAVSRSVLPSERTDARSFGLDPESISESPVPLRPHQWLPRREVRFGVQVESLWFPAWLASSSFSAALP